LAKFNPNKLAKLVEFSPWKKKPPNLSQFLCRKMTKIRQKIKRWSLPIGVTVPQTLGSKRIRKSCNSDQLSSKSPENARCGSLDTNFVIITWWHPTGRLQKQFFIDALECILACAMVTLI
jgi:hypothetical protein